MSYIQYKSIRISYLHISLIRSKKKIKEENCFKQC